jgi:hypothetical protein
LPAINDPDPHDGYADDHAAGDPNDDALTPVQQQILSELGATTAERPEFDPTLARRMQSYFDDSVRTIVDGLAATGNAPETPDAPAGAQATADSR